MGIILLLVKSYLLDYWLFHFADFLLRLQLVLSLISLKSRFPRYGSLLLLQIGIKQNRTLMKAARVAQHCLARHHDLILFDCLQVHSLLLEALKSKNAIDLIDVAVAFQVTFC